jgi:hypothetical protein
MIYRYTNYSVHPPGQPDNAVKVDAFSRRGAERKARMLLINMRFISSDIKPDKLLVRELRKGEI